jgi:hypothetical protein
LPHVTESARALRLSKSRYSKTATGFLVAVKVPQRITRKKMLHMCESGNAEFLKVMEALTHRQSRTIV